MDKTLQKEKKKMKCPKHKKKTLKFVFSILKGKATKLNGVLYCPKCNQLYIIEKAPTKTEKPSYAM